MHEVGVRDPKLTAQNAYLPEMLKRGGLDAQVAPAAPERMSLHG